MILAPMHISGKVRPRCCVLVAIVGGSGSGKTWLASRLGEKLKPDAGLISLDDFYRDRSQIAERHRARINFDHPRAIDWAAFVSALQSLAGGRDAEVPCYSFSTHCRSGSRFVPCKPVMLVEGLWLLRRPAVRRLFSLCIYLDCPARLRLERRLLRDSATRGRSEGSIRHQFRSFVEPMHRKYVATQASLADILLRECHEQDVIGLAQFIRNLAFCRVA